MKTYCSLSRTDLMDAPVVEIDNEVQLPHGYTGTEAILEIPGYGRVLLISTHEVGAVQLLEGDNLLQLRADSMYSSRTSLLSEYSSSRKILEISEQDIVECVNSYRY